MRLAYSAMGHGWLGGATLVAALAIAPVATAQPGPDEPAELPAAPEEEVLDEPAGEEGGPAAAEGAAPAAAEAGDEAADSDASRPVPMPYGPTPAAEPAPAPPGGALGRDTRYVVMRPEPPDEPEPEVPTGPYVPHWMSAELGVRNWVIFDEGIEPYSETGFVAQGAFTLNFVPFHFGDFAIGLSAEYDLGQASHHVRNIDSSVTLHRLGAGIHAQYLLSRLRFFARATPGAWHLQGSLEDDAFERPLKANGWTWGVDATGGAAIRIGSAGGPPNDRHVRFWLLAELGYGFAGEVDMAYSPEEDDEDPRVYGSVSLPPVRPSGLINRLAVAVTF